MVMITSLCLNPYCSGRWSRTLLRTMVLTLILQSLNPCCSGRWSRTILSMMLTGLRVGVLILVVVEKGLVLCAKSCYDLRNDMS